GAKPARFSARNFPPETPHNPPILLYLIRQPQYARPVVSCRSLRYDFTEEIPVPTEALKQQTTRRLRILWIVLAALLLVSITPLWLYHRQVLHLSEEKLQDTEQVQQNETTRSLASETLQFQQGVREQLVTQRQVLTLTGWIHDVDDPTYAPQLSRLLQQFAENNPNILYVTAVDKSAKGQSAGSFSADQDPFVGAALKRAF